MTSLLRLWNKVTNTPHRSEESERVIRAAKDLTESTQELASCLQPYVEADDPLVALMLDLYNQRGMRSDDATKPDLR